MTARLGRQRMGKTLLGILLVLCCTAFRHAEAVTRLLENDDGSFEFKATTDVKFLLDLAKDVADMRKAGDDLVQKKQIYLEGKHAFYVDEAGNSSQISLAGLSKGSSRVMSLDPLYNIYRNAFYDLGLKSENDSPGNFDGHPVEQYANTLVEDLFDLNSTRTETEGAVVLNVWMSVVHELNSVLMTCRDTLTDDSINDMNGALDRGAALWIGAEQDWGSNTKGHLLYNLAERAGDRFGQDYGECLVNSGVMENLNAIQFYIKENKCADETGYIEMRRFVRRVISLMTVPLVQNLIHHVVQIENEGASDIVELYGLALFPRVAACDPAAYQRLTQLMVFRNLPVDKQQVAIDEIQAQFSCWGITCADVGSYEGGLLPQCDDSQGALKKLAGFQPVEDVRWMSRIDRDINQIRIMMDWGAYDAAQDIYLYGENSYDRTTDTITSLSQLATNLATPYSSRSFDLFNTYYGTTEYEFVDDVILDVFELVAPYDEAANEQRMDIVTGLLQSVVTYLATLSQLESAIQVCQNDATSNFMSLWDGGAAYYIGSMEGSTGGGFNSGKMLYRAAQSFCSTFSTCEPDTGAAVNIVIIQGLLSGQDALSRQSCDQARSIFEGTIQPALNIPLIQGVLYYASLIRGAPAGTDLPTFGSFFAYSQALLPHIDAVASTQAEVLKSNSEFQLTDPPLSDGIEAILDVFRESLQHMATNCRDVGTLGHSGGVCADDSGTVDPPPTTPTAPVVAPVVAPSQAPSQFGTSSPPHPLSEMAWGRYTFNSESAARDSALSLDVRDIQNAFNLSEALDVYENGWNAEGLYGMVEFSTLSQISTDAHTFMQEDPIYNFFRYALYDEATFEDSANATGNASWPFADMVVRLALRPENGNSVELASHASVIMNILFLIEHRLYRANKECELGLNPANLIDSAVALWIGQGQQEGVYDSGWMMYALAQQAAKFYGHPEGESPVNAELMNQFAAAQAVAGKCQSQPSTFIELRAHTSSIIKNLMKTVLQLLVYYISIDSLDYTELYALAFVPQAVACDMRVYLSLKTALIEDFARDDTVSSEFFDNMAAMLSCLGYSCEDLGNTDYASGQIQEVVLGICLKMDHDAKDTRIVGYVPKSNITQESRIDLDLKQIRIFMKTKSYEAAATYYMHGANSVQPQGSLLSFQSMAQSQTRSAVGEQFQSFSTYFNSDKYGDDIVMAALRQQGNYASASRQQLSEIVVRTLQGMISYMSILSGLYQSVEHCSNEDIAQQQLDTAVAFYVGWLEGPKSAGIRDTGELLFSVAKEFCNSFDTCASSGNALVNEKIMQAFSLLQSRISSNDCDGAALVLREQIEPVLPVPLFEAALYYTFANEQIGVGSTNKVLATGSAFVNSVLPLINDVDPTSAATIKDNMDFNLEQSPLDAGADAVFKAFSNAINQMEVDCSDIGTLRSEARDICQVSTGSEPIERPDSETSVSLGDDLYVTTTYVQDRANIAIDVKEMEQALMDGRMDFAKLLYSEGKNSDIYDEYGIIVDHRSLGDFSVKDTANMDKEPLFNIFVYALQDESGLYLGKDAKHYANTIVQESFGMSSAKQKTVASEAAVVLNLWMYIAHSLENTLAACRKGAMAETDGIHHIDEVVAYWIGDGQVAGDGERGHLLYALAERMGEEFDINESGQSRTNQNILRAFHEAKIELSIPNTCADDPGAYRRLFHIVNRINSLMTIPLVQGLIHNLRVNDAPRVRVYAHAFVPLVATCSPSTFAYLRERLIDSTFNVIEIDDIIDRIISVYPCLDIQCDDIGVHSSELEPSCVDPSRLEALAGYSPASDVRESAEIDLDILEMNVLMQMGAYQAADDIYTLGKHSVASNQGGFATSLDFLATNGEVSVVSQYDAFVRYYDDDDKFANTIVRSALTNDRYDTATRRILAVGTSQYMILYLAALQNMQEAIIDCEANQAARDVSSAHFWDSAAAYLIGQLEGPENQGSNDGRLIFSLAREHCTEFGTCSTPSSAGVVESKVNDQIRSLLYSGRGAVLGRSCVELRRVAKELEPLILIPLIQGLLSSTLKLANSNPHHVLARVLASVLLPLIDNIDRGSAEKIKSRLALAEKPPSDTVDVVFASLKNVYSGLGLSCSDISSDGGIDVCSVGSEPSGSKNPAAAVIIVILVLLIAATAGVYLVRRKATQVSKQPVFMIPKGEMNHNDDMLHKSGGSGDTHESTPMLEGSDASDERRRAAIMSGDHVEGEVDVV